MTRLRRWWRRRRHRRAIAEPTRPVMEVGTCADCGGPVRFDGRCAECPCGSVKLTAQFLGLGAWARPR